LDLDRSAVCPSPVNKVFWGLSFDVPMYSYGFSAFQQFAGLTASFDSIWETSLIDIRQDPRGDLQANWKQDPKSIFYDLEEG
jgi:hypothetical protein